MKKIAPLFAAMLLAGVIGCDDKKTDKPVTDPVTTPAAGEPGDGVEIDAPGVKVDVDQDGVDVKTPGADVNVDR